MWVLDVLLPACNSTSFTLNRLKDQATFGQEKNLCFTSNVRGLLSMFHCLLTYFYGTKMVHATDKTLYPDGQIFRIPQLLES